MNTDGIDVTDLSGVRALTFDVFGTVVDWRTTLIDGGEALAAARGLEADWAAIADAWRRRYRPMMERVRSGELEWTNFDALHRLSLDEVLAEQGVGGLTDDDKTELVRLWRRLRPWPDSVAGLARLRTSYIVATLSNGNVRLLTDLVKAGGLPFDCILSAELFGAYKPDPRTYLGAAGLLDLPPEAVMMVAAHPYDLTAAAGQGFRTAFVERPLEWGPGGEVAEPDPGVDVVASDLLDLAARLRAG